MKSSYVSVRHGIETITASNKVGYFRQGMNCFCCMIIIGIASFYKYVIYVQNFKHVWTFLISYNFSGKIA